MSLSRLASQHAQWIATKRTAALAVAEPDEDDRFDLLVKYIPTETITLFVAAMSARGAIASQWPPIDAWALYAIGAVLTPVIYLLVAYGKQRAAQDDGPFRPAIWPIVASLIAFLTWAHRCPGSSIVTAASSSQPLRRSPSRRCCRCSRPFSRRPRMPGSRATRDRGHAQRRRQRAIAGDAPLRALPARRRTGRKNMIRNIIAAALLAAMANGAAAQTSSGTAEAPSDVAEAKARIEARTALLKAQTEERDQWLTALGLKMQTGTTSMLDKAAVIESAMLSAGAINAAAGKIRGVLPAGMRIALLTDGEKLDLSSDDVVARNLRSIVKELVRQNTQCSADAKALSDKKKPDLLSPKFVIPIGPVLPAIGAALGFLRSDVEVTGIDVAATERALVNALLAEGSGMLVVPSEVVTFASGSAIETALLTVYELRDSFAQCVQATRDKERRGARKVVADTIDSYLTELTKPGVDGQSLLARAAVAEALGEPARVRVLRVAIEKAGGSMRNRTNLWTALGVTPAVHLSGGLIVSYRLSNPATGTADKAGLLVCRTALTGFRAVQDGAVGNSQCDTSTRLASR